MGCLAYFIGIKRDFLYTPNKKAVGLTRKYPQKVFIIEQSPLADWIYLVEK
jgi:hypothetical protein